LQETWEVAHEELKKHQGIQKRQFDYRAKDRTFKPGDMMLILLSTSDSKLLMQWKGPFKGVDRVEGHDYRIQLEHKQKIFHANRLKRNFPADPKVPEDVSELSPPAELAAIQIQAVLWDSDENLEKQGAELETLNSLKRILLRTSKSIQGYPQHSRQRCGHYWNSIPIFSRMCQVSPTSLNT